MAFALKPTAPTSSEIRRLTGKRLDEALAMLADLDDADPAEIEQAVHAVRRRCKEVRSIARLVRPALGERYDRFDDAVHDAADALAPIRDAHAMLATFDDLRSSHGRQDDTDLDVVRAAQVALVEEATRGLSGNDPRIATARTLLTAGHAQVEDWDLPDGFDALGEGIEATYRRGRRAFRRAKNRPTDDHLHEWRKSLKHLWYHVRLIERAAPSVLGPLAATLDGLGEALGDDHDLAVLVERLEADPDRFGGKRPVRQTRRMARAQQDDLRRRAFRLGSTVYAESPKAFTRRMGSYWVSTVAEGPELPTGGIAQLSGGRQPLPVDATIDPARTVERERKFLVSRLPELTAPGLELRQGYLAIDDDVSVRVRDAGTEGCTITVKAGLGAVRVELEWPLSREQFDESWPRTRGRRIHKTRHRLPLDGHVVELDVFHGALDGLVLAEVEFDTDDALDAFRPPAWFGTEVTGDDRYTNASLAKTSCAPTDDARRS